MQDICEIYQNIILKIGVTMNSEAQSLVKDGQLCDKTLNKIDKLARVAARISLVRSRAMTEKKQEEKRQEKNAKQEPQENQDSGGVENSKEVLARPDLQKLVREMKEEMLENSKKHPPYSKEAFLKDLEENPIPRMQQVF